MLFKSTKKGDQFESTNVRFISRIFNLYEYLPNTFLYKKKESMNISL